MGGEKHRRHLDRTYYYGHADLFMFTGLLVCRKERYFNFYSLDSFRLSTAIGINKLVKCLTKYVQIGESSISRRPSRVERISMR